MQEPATKGFWHLFRNLYNKERGKKGVCVWLIDASVLNIWMTYTAAHFNG